MESIGLARRVSGACTPILLAGIICLLDAAILFGAPPPEFTGEDQNQLDSARARMGEIRKEVLNRKTSDESAQELRIEAARLTVTIDGLEARQRNWQRHLEERAQQETTNFNYGEMFGALEVFAGYEKRIKSGTNPPSPREWEQLAARLHEIQVTAVQGKNDPRLPYIFRAALLEADCFLNASVQCFRGGKVQETLAYHKKGIELLNGFLWTSEGYDEKATGALPPTHPAAPRGTFWYAGVCPETDWLGSQPTTRGVARRNLGDYCPWGVEIYAMLEEGGYTRGLDLRILRPYGGEEKLYEAVLKENVPRNIQREIEEAEGGLLRHMGQEARIEWAVKPKTTYSIWFMSPTVYDWSASYILSWANRAVKLFQSGILNVLIDEALGQLLSAIGWLVPPGSDGYAACGYVVDLKKMGVVTNKLIVDKDATDIPYKASKQLFLKAGQYLEKLETEYLFDSVDPNNSDIRDYMGRPRTYYAAHLPPVIIRVDMIGAEKTPEYKYRKVWHVIRYYQLDPGGMAPGYRYDLGKALPAPDAVAKHGKDLSASAEESVHARYWRMLPNKPKQWGSRLFLMDFTPMGQIFSVKASRRLLDKWAKGLPEGHSVFMQVRYPEPVGVEKPIAEVKAVEGYNIIKVMDAVAPMDDETFQMVMQHPRTEVHHDTIANEYRVVIVARAGTAGKDGKYQERVLESHPIAMYGKPGKAYRGERRTPCPGVVEVVYQLEEPFETEPDTSTVAGDVLEKAVIVNNLDAPGGTIKSIGNLDYTCDLEAYVAPVGKGRCALSIEMNGRKFRAWDVVEGDASAGVFKVRLPLVVGENKIVVSAEGAKPVSFAMVRPQPRESRLDFAAADETIKESVRKTDAAKARGDTEAYYSELGWLFSDNLRAAEMYISAGLHASARPYIDFVLKSIPAQGPEAKRFAGTFARANKALAEVAFFQGDGKTLYAAANDWLAAETARLTAEAEGGKPSASRCKETADACGTMLERYILLEGGGPQIRWLWGKYEELMKMAGPYDPEYDRRRFKQKLEGMIER